MKIIKGKACLALYSVILVVTFLIYYPGSYGGFIYDDYPNIVSNLDITIDSLQVNDLLKAAYSSLSGPLKRPISMLTFSVNYYYAGLDPYFYKITNIVIHLLNGILAGMLSYLICTLAARRGNLDSANIRLISYATAALWLVHPINLSSVLYVVQRMNSLAALFTFLGLCLYISGRKKIEDNNNGWPGILFALLICGPLAILSKENGVLLYLFILLVEFIFFSRKDLSEKNRKILHAALGLFIGLPALLLLAVAVINPQIVLEGYSQKNFGPVERLLTQLRVLWFYIYLILIPNIQRMSLHHDDFSISMGLFDPVTTSVSLVGIFLLVFAAIKFRYKSPLITFGILFFFAGHVIESTVLPLMIAFEHRNYVPSFGLLFILAFLFVNHSISPGTRNIRRIAIVILIGILAVSTHVRARQWGNPELFRFHELRHNPDSPQVNYEVGRFYATSLESDYIDNSDLVFDKANYYFNQVIKLEPDNIEAMVGLLILNFTYHGEIKYNILSKLTNILGSGQITTTGASAVRAMFRCNMTKECDFPDAILDQLIKSVEMNTNFNGRNAELVYSDFSKYYLHVDNEEALRMAKTAVIKNSKSMDARVYLTSLLIEMQKYKEAEQEIRILEQMDNFNFYSNRINQLNEILVSHRSQ